MSDAPYPFGDALVPASFDTHVVIFLIRAPDAPALDEAALDRLQAEHLTYLRDLMRRGILVANGPLDGQTDPRLRGLSVYALPLDDAVAVARADPMVRAGWLVIEGARWLTPPETARFDGPRGPTPA